VIRNPKRTETGIAPSTVAVMLPVGNVRKANSPRKSASTWASARQFSSAEENWNQEIWVMYQLREINRQQSTNNNQQTEVGKIKNKVKDKKSIISNLKFQISNSAKPKICIISAWRYPGVSPKNNPIPEEIFRELEEINDQ
jgi:hypothetical protein